MCLGESVTDVDQLEAEGRDSLLAVNEVTHPVALRRHDRPQEVRTVRSRVAPLVGVAMFIEEPTGEVVDELTDLGLFPAVLTLVEVEAVATP